MPRPQQILYKYKCLEPGCQKLIRQDKWTTHCKTEHGFKVKRFVFVVPKFDILNLNF